MKGTTLCSALLLLAAELVPHGHSFSIHPPPILSRGPATALRAERAELESERSLPASDGKAVDANAYNVPLEEAVELWTVSVQESNNADRKAGVPFLDSKSKDYFVDDVSGLEVSREGGLGMDLLELAGGRDDGIGITVVSAVAKGGNAEAAGVLPGDSISGVVVNDATSGSSSPLAEESKSRSCDCEARDFDGTIDALANFPGDDAEKVVLYVKRIRRWPKVRVQVEYPASQCAEGFDPVREIEFFAGENLKRALQNRGIVLDDPANPKCDYCGSNACYVSIVKGKHLLNPVGITEKKLMEQNPNCRLSCKTTVGYNMQEGDLRLKVNLSQWKE